MGRLEGVSPEDYPARRHSLFVQGDLAQPPAPERATLSHRRGRLPIPYV